MTNWNIRATLRCSKSRDPPEHHNSEADEEHIQTDWSDRAGSELGEVDPRDRRNAHSVGEENDERPD